MTIEQYHKLAPGTLICFRWATLGKKELNFSYAIVVRRPSNRFRGYTVFWVNPEYQKNWSTHASEAELLTDYWSVS